MSSLFGSLSISLGALLADQGALQTTSSNIANANTPGYTRRRALIEEQPPAIGSGLAIGRGVALVGIESVRDRILELRIAGEVQQQSAADSYVSAMNQVESIFSGTATIAFGFDGFFNALTRLSTTPSDIPLRQAVLTAGANLADTFRVTARKLSSVRRNLDLGIVQAVAQANQLTKQIAGVNIQVASLETKGEDTGALEDQRTQLIRQLSGLLNFSVAQSSDGLTLTTPSGSPLVVGDKAYAFEASSVSAGDTHILAAGTDVTAELNAGQIGGLLLARDQTIPQALGELDGLAFSFANRINTLHRNGFDLGKTAGQDPFTTIATESGAAENMRLALDDPSKLAASADGNAGDNANLLRLASVRNEQITSNGTPADIYSKVVFEIGSATDNAMAESDASTLALQQLESQRGALSGVSMDEEAANLIRFQRAFQAAARMITVINELTETAVNLGRV